MRLTRRAAIRFVSLAIVVGAMVTLAVRPGKSRLEWYTSPPISLEPGVPPVRLRTLMPACWSQGMIMDATSGGLRPNQRWTDELSIENGPDRRLSVFPEPIRRLLLGAQQPRIRLTIIPRSTEDDGVTVHAPGSGIWLLSVHRTLRRGALSCGITYETDDEALFESTYRQVCDSLRLVQ